MAVLPTDQAKTLLSMLKELDVFYVRVISSPTIGSFTGLRSTLDVKSDMSAPLSDLWWVDAKTLSETSEDPHIVAAVNRLAILAQDTTTAKRLCRDLWSMTEERNQFLAIIRALLLPLTGQDIMAVNIREYPESLVIGQPVHRAHLGMGSPLTWHSAPDGRCEVDIINIDITDEDEDSCGSKTPIEMKLTSFGWQNLNPVLGNAVVFSFVQHKRHPKMNPLVPVVGISGNQGQLIVTAYDACGDVLLHSVPITWLDFRTGQFQVEGLLAIWLGLDHRLFLRRVTGEEPCSGLQERLRRDGALTHF